MLSNLPVDLGGYKLMITEAPTVKTRINDKTGKEETVLNRDDDTPQFVVSMFAKRRPQEGQYVGKGEEIKVTLTADQGDGFDEGSYVQLISATVSHWQNERDGRYSSGLAYRALGLTPQ